MSDQEPTEADQPHDTTETPAADATSPAVAGEIPKEERTMGMVAHLAALAGFTGIPAANILGPLIVWMIKKDTMPFVDQEGKEAVNFQITVTLAILICIPLMFVCVGFILAAAIGIASLVLTIIAAIKANEGVAYHYPMTIRLIK